MKLFILFLIVFGVLGLTLLIFISILGLRLQVIFEEKLRQRAFLKMEPFLFALLADEIVPRQWAVRIPRRQLVYLQEFLIPYLESLKGEAFEKLVAVANYSGLVKQILKDARSKESWKQAQAIYFLGLIREHQAINYLEHGLTSGNIFWFYTSVIALARNGLQFFPRVLDVLDNRPDWTELLAISILAEFGEEVCPAFLAALTQQKLSVRMERLALTVIAHFGYKEARLILVDYIKYSGERELLIQALKTWSILKLDFFDGIAYAMDDLSWEVRVAAVTALGTSGAVEEVRLACRLLRDSSWWVRLRAAQTMQKLGAHEETFAFLSNPMEDRYAQDMLRYVQTSKWEATHAHPNLNVI